MMKLSLTALKNLLSEHIWLEFSEGDRERAKPAERDYSNETGRNNAFVSRLCLNALTNWMQDNLALETKVTVFPNEVSLASIWEVVSGTALNIGSKRIALIPSDTIDTEELAVPQEWVDIPSWAADYYLAVQVNLDNRYLHIWGFVSRQTLKAKSEYDPIYRTYHLDEDYLIDDLEVLWISLDVGDEKGKVETLPTLSDSEAKSLIQKLSQPSPYSPRLDVKFEQWGALLNEGRWLQELYERRKETVTAKIPLKRSILNLRQWLENNFNEATQAGWLGISEFLSPQPSLAASKRNSALANKVKRAKLLNLQLQMRQQAVVLLVAVTPETDGRCGVLVQAHPSSGQRYLPASLSITLLSELGEELKSVVAREQDNYIQLNYFRCQPGTLFSIKLALDGVTTIEDFAI